MKLKAAVILTACAFILSFTGCIKNLLEGLEPAITETTGDITEAVTAPPPTEDITEPENIMQAAAELAPREVARLCTPAVFYVEVYDQNNHIFGTGSGFFLTDDGVAVTNYHVIDGAHSALIKTTSDEIYNILGYYYLNAEADVAVLKIGAPSGVRFPVLKIGSIELIEQGERIYAIGSPFGLDNTFTEGLISNAYRSMDKAYIQHSAPISAGNSGGPLINSFGEVIGVNTSVYEQYGSRIGQNLNFAVPITTIDINSYQHNLPQPFTNAPWINNYYAQGDDGYEGDWDWDGYAADGGMAYIWMPHVPDFGLLAGISAGSGEEWADEDGDSVFTYRYDPDWLEIPLETVIMWRGLYDTALALFDWEKYNEWVNEEEEYYGMVAWFKHPGGNLLRYRWYSHTIWIDIYYNYDVADKPEWGVFASEIIYPWIYNVPDFGKLVNIDAGYEEEWMEGESDALWNVYTYRYDAEWLGIPPETVFTWRTLYDIALFMFGWEKYDESEAEGEIYGITAWFENTDGSHLRYRWFADTVWIDIFYGVG